MFNMGTYFVNLYTKVRVSLVERGCEWGMFKKPQLRWQDADGDDSLSWEPHTCRHWAEMCISLLRDNCPHSGCFLAHSHKQGSWVRFREERCLLEAVLTASSTAGLRSTSSWSIRLNRTLALLRLPGAPLNICARIGNDTVIPPCACVWVPRLNSGHHLAATPAASPSFPGLTVTGSYIDVATVTGYDCPQEDALWSEKSHTRSLLFPHSSCGVL